MRRRVLVFALGLLVASSVLSAPTIELQLSAGGLVWLESDQQDHYSVGDMVWVETSVGAAPAARRFIIIGGP